MARAQHMDPAWPSKPGSGAEGQGYDPGGQVAHLQADLERRFLAADTVPVPDAMDHRVERVVGFVSILSGYVAVAAVYAGVALLILS